MTRCSLIVALVLLVMAPLSAIASSEDQGLRQGSKDVPVGCCQEVAMAKSDKSREIDLKQAGTTTQEPVLQDPAKRNACDCCQKCKAAKGVIKSKEDEKEDDNNGCEDCCARCGEPLTPARQDIPPEIINKNPPPDIKEKGKQ